MTTHARRTVLAGLLGTALMLAGAAPVLAQAWPARPVTLVVPFAAGGTTDIIGRIVGRNWARPCASRW